jgi:hypothetical protein
MMAVMVSSGEPFTVGKPSLLFERDYSYSQGVTIPNYDVTPDGHFVMVKTAAQAQRRPQLVRGAEGEGPSTLALWPEARSSGSKPPITGFPGAASRVVMASPR